MEPTGENFSAAQDNNLRAHKRFRTITLLTLVINGGGLLFIFSLSLFSRLVNASGMEFVALAFMPVIYFGYALAIFYMVYFIYYVLRYKQKNSYVLIGAIMWVVSVALVVMMIYGINLQKKYDAAAGRVLSVEEVGSLVNSCNIDSVDEGGKRFQATQGDYTYITIKEKINGEGASLKRYARMSDFRTIVNMTNAATSKCGSVTIYTKEDLSRGIRNGDF